MTAARLVVWRHGRTEWNASGRFQGHADVPLDQLGRQQAERAAVELAALEPVQIISSDLARARETAEALGRRTGLAVTTDRRLREIHVGSWEGLTADEVIAVDPELAHRFYLGEDVRRSPTGETVEEVSARVAQTMVEVSTAAAEGTTVVVVTHGVAGRVGACRMVGLPPESWRLLSGLHNCGWITLERHRLDYWRIHEYNLTAALRPAPSIS